MIGKYVFALLLVCSLLRSAIFLIRRLVRLNRRGWMLLKGWRNGRL